MHYVNEKDVRFQATGSEGPGGQNVNRRATKIHAWVPVEKLNLSAEEKKLVRARLAHRVTKKDELEITDEEERFQGMNRENAVEHMEKVIAEAVKENPPRIAG